MERKSKLTDDRIKEYLTKPVKSRVVKFVVPLVIAIGIASGAVYIAQKVEDQTNEEINKCEQTLEESGLMEGGDYAKHKALYQFCQERSTRDEFLELINEDNPEHIPELYEIVRNKYSE